MKRNAALRSLDDPKLLDRYLELKAEIKRIQAEIDEIQPAILDALLAEPEEDGRQKVTHMGHTISVQRRKKWVYPQHLVQMRRDLGRYEKDARADGDAELKSETAFLRVTAAR